KRDTLAPLVRRRCVQCSLVTVQAPLANFATRCVPARRRRYRLPRDGPRPPGAAEARAKACRARFRRPRMIRPRTSPAEAQAICLGQRHLWAPECRSDGVIHAVGRPAPALVLSECLPIPRVRYRVLEQSYGATLSVTSE